MGIDVIDVVRGCSSIPQGGAHGTSAAVCIRGGDIDGIRTHAKTQDLGVDARASCEGALARFQHEHRGSLAQDKPRIHSSKKADRYRCSRRGAPPMP